MHLKERKPQTIYLSERYSAEFKQTIEMNEDSLPETVFTTFEFSGLCSLMQNTEQWNERVSSH